MATLNYNKFHKHDVSCANFAEEKYYKVQGNFKKSIGIYNYTYHDDNVQNNLVGMSSNTNISRELACGRNKFTNCKNVSFIRTSGITTSVNPHQEGISINNKPIFPPRVPTPNISNNFDHVAFGVVNERSSFRGLRKQFSGRFKRFVSKQPKTSNSIIPPELKSQLKVIYVY